MKSFTPLFLLLVGIISSCIAKNIDNDTDQVQGSSSTEEPERMQQLKTACYEKTGSDQAFGAFIASTEKMDNCFYKTSSATYETDLYYLNATTRHDFFPKYRSELRKSLRCFRPPMMALRKCLDDDIYEVRKVNAFPEVLDLVCENNGEILFRNGTSYEVCTKNLLDYHMECENTITMSTYMMAVPKYGEAQCEDLAKSRGCMERKLKECNGPQLIDVLDVYWRAVLKNSPCENVNS